MLHDGHTYAIHVNKGPELVEKFDEDDTLGARFKHEEDPLSFERGYFILDLLVYTVFMYCLLFIRFLRFRWLLLLNLVFNNGGNVKLRV